MKPHKEANVVSNVPNKKYPLKAEDYKLYEVVGQGVSASVYRALCIPLNEIVAIKVMDLERYSTDLDNIRREVQTMTLIGHPNLLKSHCSFVADTSLWIVTPYMDSGSCVYIMKYGHPTGFEQSIIATLLHGVLKALAYLHSEGLIHRDVKAGNVLVDSKCSVKLADFGVSASLFDNGDRRHARNTFVGTPCWMAPEVMQQLHGYDFKADIWSFGITALELAHGHAPFSNYPPMKVLLMTIQNAPPSLDYGRDKKFSKSFKNLVSTCLVKDPKKRPTAEKLLKHRFFRYAQSKDYVVQTILKGLPPLGERYRVIKEKEANLLAQNKANLDEDQVSQKEYIRGISAWDFDPDKLKYQAALLGDDSDDEDIIPSTENHESGKQKDEFNTSVVQEKLVERSDRSDLDNLVKSMMSNNLDLEGSAASLPNKAFQGPENDAGLPLGRDISISLSGENASPEVSFISKPKGIENPDCPKDVSNGFVSECSGKSANSLPMTAAAMLPSLQHLLEQNSLQKEQIMTCLKYLGQEPVSNKENIQVGNSETLLSLQNVVSSSRERALESHLVSMQQFTDKLVQDLEIQKKACAKLEKKIKALNGKE